jgi:hypothetical protein
MDIRSSNRVQITGTSIKFQFKITLLGTHKSQNMMAAASRQIISAPDKIKFDLDI